MVISATRGQEGVPLSPRRQRATIVIVCLATAMLCLDIAVVNTALPFPARDLHSGLSGVQWVVGAYTVALAAIVLSAGRWPTASAAARFSRSAWSSSRPPRWRAPWRRASGSSTERGPYRGLA